jgi:hypothetical protein
MSGTEVYKSYQSTSRAGRRTDVFHFRHAPSNGEASRKVKEGGKGKVQ